MQNSSSPAQQVAPAAVAPASSSNGFAVISVIMGALIFIPLITSLLAVVFGSLGLRKAEKGRGLALAGIILGVVGLLGWTAGGIVIYKVYKSASSAVEELRSPGQATASRFIRQLSQGEVNAALRDTEGASESSAGKLSLDMRRWGSFKDLAITDWDVSNVDGATRLKLSGQANFSKTSRAFSVTLAKQGSGLKIVDYSFE